jgi:3-oxoacyl-[acyl-carrier-protein] synthase III
MATRRALDSTYLRKPHIELLVYVGVGRGFLEPGNSHMMANALGFNNAQCFDVVDACMSWIRALSLVDSLFKTGAYKNALIINAEFNMFENGPLYPANYALTSEEQLPYTFPSFTIGEAATATLLLPKLNDNFEFHFSTRPDLSSLCTIPLEGYTEFCHPEAGIGKNDVLRFTSFGEALHKEGHDEAIRIFRALRRQPPFKQVFVHASSKKEWDKFGAEVRVEDKIFHVYPYTGNLVSASIPTAIDAAVQKHQVRRGDRLALWAGSAGMSFGAASFTF